MKYLILLFLLVNCAGKDEIVIFGGSNSNALGKIMTQSIQYGSGGSRLDCLSSDNCWNGGQHLEKLIQKIKENKIHPTKIVMVQMAGDSNSKDVSSRYYYNFRAVKYRLEDEFGPLSWSIVLMRTSYKGEFVSELREIAHDFYWECIKDLNNYPSDDGIHLTKDGYFNLAKDLEECL